MENDIGSFCTLLLYVSYDPAPNLMFNVIVLGFSLVFYLMCFSRGVSVCGFVRKAQRAIACRVLSLRVAAWRRVRCALRLPASKQNKRQQNEI